MSEKNCEVCQKLGKKGLASTKDLIYSKHAYEVRISLCNAHSIELYKRGQESFILKYSLEKKKEVAKIPNL